MSALHWDSTSVSRSSPLRFRYCRMGLMSRRPRRLRGVHLGVVAPRVQAIHLRPRWTRPRLERAFQNATPKCRWPRSRDASTAPRRPAPDSPPESTHEVTLLFSVLPPSSRRTPGIATVLPASAPARLLVNCCAGQRAIWVSSCCLHSCSTPARNASYNETGPDGWYSTYADRLSRRLSCDD
jgi:hypothetical protein